MRASPLRSALNGAMLVVALIVIWQLVYWSVGDSGLSSPLETARYTVALVTREGFGEHLYDTMRAFFIAFVISVTFGLSLGFWLGFDRLSGDVFEPMFATLYAIPKLTLYPILLLALGLGAPAKVGFGVLHGLIPIVLFTVGAVRNTRPILLKTGRVLKLSRWQTVRWILCPSAIPEIFTGLRVGFSLTLIGTLLAEMFASQRGLGYLLMTAIGLHNLPQIMSVTVLIVAFAASVSTLLLWMDRRLHERG